MNKNSNMTKFDIKLLIVIIIVISFGILTIYSAGFDPVDKLNNGMYKRQIMWFVIGFFLMIGISFLDYKVIGAFAPHIYLINLFILILTTFFAPIIRGSRAWIDFGLFSIQPSEFMKLSTVILLAKYIELRDRDLHNFRELFIPAIIILFPILFIILQSDFGTAMIFIPILFALLFVGGADISHIVSILSIAFFSLTVPLTLLYFEDIGTAGLVSDFFNQGMAVFAVAGFFLFIAVTFYMLHLFFVNKVFRYIYMPSFVFSLSFIFSPVVKRLLQGYQKNRILAFLNPDKYPHDLGYNVIQSKIAIGSGGFFGKGILKGTQTQLGFLPETTSDFIFSVICEEWGFIGAFLLLILLFVIVYRSMKTALVAGDKFGSLLATGITCIYFFHILINVGITIGIIPVTGIPLVFVSYGGSNMMMSMIGLGFLLSIQSKKSTF